MNLQQLEMFLSQNNNNNNKSHLFLSFPDSRIKRRIQLREVAFVECVMLIFHCFLTFCSRSRMKMIISCSHTDSPVSKSVIINTTKHSCVL